MSRAMKKKIAFLLYDADTAIGINNEGSLVFSYNLEDTDQTAGGADIFNGQQSVLWKNLREMFPNELKSMYQTLRSRGVLSYARVEQAFEEHQAKWPEAIFNEDAWFKYLAPLEEKGSAAYLAMLQGTKAEQRKWWLYNRFRYIDSKYNAGDSLTDVITLRGYAKANITLRPYADVYCSVKFGSYLVQTRGERNHSYEMVCPLDNVNDTEIYIYSASQLADVGDLSGLKVGYAEFVYATKLQQLILGSNAAGYTNGNLQTLYLGNNKLLKKLDVRNCSGLGTGDQKTVDLSGCTGIEEAYFDGTAITGVSLPNGGVLRVLHLPSTVTALTIQNQPSLTDLTCPSFSNITTLWLENVGSTVDTMAMVEALRTGARVRIFGFTWNVQTLTDISDMLDILDNMRGLDQNGNNMDSAQVYGTIHVPNATGDVIAHAHARYPDITITYDHVSATLTYRDNDGTVLGTETILDGAAPVSTPTVTNKEDGRYYYTFLGWGRSANGSVDATVFTDIESDTTAYAIYSLVEKTFTVSFYNGSTLLTTFQNVAYGATVNYNVTPTYSGPGNAGDYIFTGWSPLPENITQDTVCYAQYSFTGSYFRSYLEGTLSSYTDSQQLTSIAPFAFAGEAALQSVSMPYLLSVPEQCFADVPALTSVDLPEVLALNDKSFAYASAIETITLPKCAVLNGSNNVWNCGALTELRLPLNTSSFATGLILCAQVVTLDVGVTTTLGTNLDRSYYANLTNLIMRNTSQICEAYAATMFRSGSPLKNGTGLILVPRTMVASYKADSKWSGYSSMIVAIEDHPEICG